MRSLAHSVSLPGKVQMAQGSGESSPLPALSFLTTLLVTLLLRALPPGYRHLHVR